MRLGSFVFVACATIATIVAGAAFGHELAQRDQADGTAAVSSALPLSRRVDSTMDRYTYSAKAHTPANRLTGAQKWIAARADPLVAYDSDPRVSLFVRGWAGAPPVSAYYNATGVNLYTKTRLKEAAPWLIKRAGVYSHIDAWALLDIRQPAARHWWLYGSDGEVSCTPDRDRRGALDLIACGYTGLWLDNLLSRPSASYTPNPGIDDASWGAGLVALLQELRAALPAGVPFTVNAHWTDVDFAYAQAPRLESTMPLVQISKLADQLVIEGGAIDQGIDYDATADTAWSYRRLLSYADAIHGGGAKIQWEKTSSTDLTAKDAKTAGRLPNCRAPAWKKGDRIWKAHVRTAAFNAATAWLTFQPGDSVGDLCEYPGRGWRGYGVDLGAPLTIRIDTGTALTRPFSGGYVAVNPGSKVLRVSLPDGHTGINLASTAKVVDDRVASSFRLPARSALVIRYAS